ncbi:MAG: GNAT family N-acetyltransferase [Phycisphaerales bacterium]|nr:GNAT family N-acetyltransferase [Phycisphaerales bacterium]
MSEEQRLALRDGRSVTVRHSRQGDAQRVHAYICALGRSTDMILTCAEDLPPIERIQSHIEMIPKGQFYSLVAIDPETGDVVGNASFRFAVRKKLAHTADLGMGVLPSHQGLGLGTALLTRAIEEMRAHPTVERLDLTVLARNITARRMYTRAGFVEEGVKVRGLRQLDGSYDDEVIMAMWVGES